MATTLTVLQFLEELAESPLAQTSLEVPMRESRADVCVSQLGLGAGPSFPALPL